MQKWEDSWFSSLKQIEMLLFMYLCDNCNFMIGGEYKKMGFD